MKSHPIAKGNTTILVLGAIVIVIIIALTATGKINPPQDSANLANRATNRVHYTIATGDIKQPKRTAPRWVADVEFNDLIIRNHSDNGLRYMDTIEAVNKDTHAQVWKAQLYDTPYTTGMEADAQEIFIKDMELTGGVLVVMDENNTTYYVNPTNGHMLHTK